MADGGPVTVEQHLERILAAVRPLPPTDLPLLEALGLVATADVHSDLDLPRFDNSAMDGYAVRVADVEGAREDAPVSLPVGGEIGAGKAGPSELFPGEAVKIMTGAPLPPGADAVVPYEWTDRGAETVRITQAPAPGQHLRPIGDDVRHGDLLLAAGTPLGPRQLGLLAATGHPVVTVRPRPRVVVLSTGAELRDPGEELAADSIFDGNSYLLAAAVTRVGAAPRRVGIVGDEPEVFLKRLREELRDADLVVTSGGVSQGDYDVVKHTLRELGVWFGTVAMQPGKPQGFGVVDGVPVCTLPGNPVSAFISFELFVRPALRRMMGREPLAEPPQTARLAEGVRSPHGKRQYLRGRLERDGSVRSVMPVGGSGSHLVANLAAADALIVVPEEVTELAAGTEVSIVLLEEP